MLRFRPHKNILPIKMDNPRQELEKLRSETKIPPSEVESVKLAFEINNTRETVLDSKIFQDVLNLDKPADQKVEAKEMTNASIFVKGVIIQHFNTNSPEKLENFSLNDLMTNLKLNFEKIGEISFALSGELQRIFPADLHFKSSDILETIHNNSESYYKTLEEYIQKYNDLTKSYQTLVENIKNSKSIKMDLISRIEELNETVTQLENIFCIILNEIVKVNVKFENSNTYIKYGGGCDAKSNAKKVKKVEKIKSASSWFGRIKQKARNFVNKIKKIGTVAWDSWVKIVNYKIWFISINHVWRNVNVYYMLSVILKNVVYDWGMLGTSSENALLDLVMLISHSVCKSILADERSFAIVVSWLTKFILKTPLLTRVIGRSKLIFGTVLSNGLLYLSPLFTYKYIRSFIHKTMLYSCEIMHQFGRVFVGSGSKTATSVSSTPSITLPDPMVMWQGVQIKKSLATGLEKIRSVFTNSASSNNVSKSLYDQFKKYSKGIFQYLVGDYDQVKNTNSDLHGTFNFVIGNQGELKSIISNSTISQTLLPKVVTTTSLGVPDLNKQTNIVSILTNLKETGLALKEKSEGYVKAILQTKAVVSISKILSSFFTPVWNLLVRSGFQVKNFTHKLYTKVYVVSNLTFFAQALAEEIPLVLDAFTYKNYQEYKEKECLGKRDDECYNSWLDYLTNQKNFDHFDEKVQKLEDEVKKWKAISREEKINKQGVGFIKEDPVSGGGEGVPKDISEGLENSGVSKGGISNSVVSENGISNSVVSENGVPTDISEKLENK